MGVCRVCCVSRVACSYVAAKNYYFSVGGGCRQFEEMVKKDGLFDTTVEKVIKGLEPITSYARAATYSPPPFSSYLHHRPHQMAART